MYAILTTDERQLILDIGYISSDFIHELEWIAVKNEICLDYFEKRQDYEAFKESLNWTYKEFNINQQKKI